MINCARVDVELQMFKRSCFFFINMYITLEFEKVGKITEACAVSLKSRSTKRLVYFIRTRHVKYLYSVTYIHGMTEFRIPPKIQAIIQLLTPRDPPVFSNV